MTQEELDALMNSDLDSEDTLESETVAEVETQSNETQEAKIEDVKVADYRPNPNLAWPPPPPSQEHKVVHQLDDVTKDSEQKATEMMERLENISNFFVDSESLIADINKILDKNIEIFTRLNEKFPNVESFSEALESNTKAKKMSGDIVDHLQGGQDEVMMAMDAMQYQDIHRQKIERVINVMRALSRYMSSLFEGRIDDKKRVSSAVHIEGDSTAEVVSNDDIEALIASLGQK
ncbi:MULTISPECIES: protein phosphatase CheZ [Campylobacter]|uniref:Chemotaxis protein n=1 Tax=Campylobacter taeniopygiae TaxID=2510188 RepID=A0ABY2TH69_9BACT|nr:protein phosphatase CheZ [Campylobacter taeniopygiae]MBZ7935545.1 chemotaxis protein [Campylobacter sp. B0100352/1]TKX33336.1 chemotaxis protein [Campylobacter taeniopygiae]